MQVLLIQCLVLLTSVRVQRLDLYCACAVVVMDVIDLENKISTAEIINPTELQRDGRVVFGVIVTFIDLNTDEQFKYQIVGEDEANIREGKISYVSPIARALIGKIEDDITEFDIPSGKREVQIIKVEYEV